MSKSLRQKQQVTVTYICVRCFYLSTTNSHVKFHQPGPSGLSTLDLNANVNAKMSKSFRQKQQVTVTYICVRFFQLSTTNSHVKFHQPGPGSLSTLDLNVNVNIGRRRRRRLRRYTGDDISSLPVLRTGELKIKENGEKSKMFSIFNMYSVVIHDI